MKKELNAMKDDASQLATHARALFAATADTASDKVIAARDKLEAILDQGRDVTDSWRESAKDGARYCRDTIKDHPYQSLGIGLAIGTLIGLCIVRNHSPKHARKS